MMRGTCEHCGSDIQAYGSSEDGGTIFWEACETGSDFCSDDKESPLYYKMHEPEPVAA